MSRTERNIVVGMVALVAAIVFGLVAVTRVGAEGGEAPFAQEGDVIVTDPAPFDIGQWLNENDTILFILAIIALIVTVGRQPLLELVRGGINSVPAGLVQEVVKSSVSVAIQAARVELEKWREEALKTPNTLDDEGVKALLERLAEVERIVKGEPPSLPAG
jgi:hypothetical protein